MEYIAGKAQTSGKVWISGKGPHNRLGGVATNLAPNMSVGVSPHGKAEKLRASWLAGTSSLSPTHPRLRKSGEFLKKIF